MNPLGAEPAKITSNLSVDKLKNNGGTPEPVTQSCDTGQWIPFLTAVN